MRDLSGILLSYVYFFGLRLLASLFKEHSELGRKFFHILSGNWWFIVLFFFSTVWTASVVPLSCICIYFLMKRKSAGFLLPGRLLSGLERAHAQETYGIVLYPMGMLLLVILSFAVLKAPYVGGLGLMALAYGDGFAALAGKKYRYGRFTIWGNQKTLSGCAGMFIATSLSITIYLFLTNNIIFPVHIFLLVVALLAFAATLFEAITPAGFDNITIPLSVVGSYWVIAKLYLG